MAGMEILVRKSVQLIAPQTPVRRTLAAVMEHVTLVTMTTTVIVPVAAIVLMAVKGCQGNVTLVQAKDMANTVRQPAVLSVMRSTVLAEHVTEIAVSVCAAVNQRCTGTCVNTAALYIVSTVKTAASVANVNGRTGALHVKRNARQNV